MGEGEDKIDEFNNLSQDLFVNQTNINANTLQLESLLDDLTNLGVTGLPDPTITNLADPILVDVVLVTAPPAASLSVPTP